MTRSKSIAIAGTLAAVLFLAPTVQAMGDAIGTAAESVAKSLLHPLWPSEHGKCFTLDRFDPTCPQCL
jgi:hypothetical protein